MLPASAQDFEQLISKPRLDSYKSYFHVKTLEEAVGLYMWNCELSAAFTTLLSYYELALRNSIHRSMSLFYSRGQLASDHWYDHIWQQLKYDTQNQVDKIRTVRGPGGVLTPRNPPPKPDEIVSRVTFGFWPAVLGSLDKRYVTQLLPSIFPHHPLTAQPQSWTIKPTRVSALAYIYELNAFRNRIAHHEPLWKFAGIMNTAVQPPAVQVPASASEADSLARFSRLLTLFEEGVRSLSPDLMVDLQKSSWRRKLTFLLSTRGVSRYRKLLHIPRESALTPAEFRSRFTLLVKANRPVRITRSRMSGVFDPD
jgi:hypothetical protein